MPEVVEQAEQAQSRPAPTGVDLLHSVIARLAGLEARMLEVERCKHTDHTIPQKTLDTISKVVIARVVELLTPKSAERTE